MMIEIETTQICDAGSKGMATTIPIRVIVDPVELTVSMFIQWLKSTKPPDHPKCWIDDL